MKSQIGAIIGENTISSIFVLTEDTGSSIYSYFGFSIII